MDFVMKKLPVGIQSFKKIIEGDCVYVDKTKYIYDLITDASYYFLSRPRRFGKSLLLDTISEVFSGDRELFRGLWIYDSDYEFPKHPVLRIDMSNIANETPEILKESLASYLHMRVKDEGLDIPSGIPSDIFRNLIQALHRKYDQRVVVLIDEYDKPVLDHLLRLETADANRDVIRGLYGVLKSMDPHLRLTFITGVSKFIRTSLFSEMNNLLDITMKKKYSNICGIPTEELKEHFHEHIEKLATHSELGDYDHIHDRIIDWYDGYSWDGETRVINPFGLLTFFAQERFSSFWYASGSPKFLLDIIKQKPETYANLNNYAMGEWELDIFDVHRIEVAPLLFQTGYLTVRGTMPSPGSFGYLLKIPNFEVREALNLHIMAELTDKGATIAGAAYRKLYEALNTGDLQSMLDVLKGLFSSIPYQLHIDREAYYHSIFYAVMSVLGFDVDAEVSVAKGRIDAVLELADKVYVMEFKYVDCNPDISPEEKRKLFDTALDEGVKQIHTKGYAQKYTGSGKEVIQAAFAFLGRDNIETRRLEC